MQSWLSIPWVQAGVAPFLAGLVTAELFNRLRLSGLALAAGVATTVFLALPSALTAALDDPLRKLLAVILAGGALGLLLDLLPPLRRILAALIAVAAAALVVWATWPTLAPERLLGIYTAGSLALAYAAWTAGATSLLARLPERASAAGIALGISSGASLWLNGAHDLALLAFAAGAASAAHWSIQLISNEPLRCGNTFTLALAAVVALAPPIGTLTAALPWPWLLGLAGVSAAALIPLSATVPARTKGLLALLITGAAGAGAVALGWYVVGPALRWA